MQNHHIQCGKQKNLNRNTVGALLQEGDEAAQEEEEAAQDGSTGENTDSTAPGIDDQQEEEEAAQEGDEADQEEEEAAQDGSTGENTDSTTPGTDDQQEEEAAQEEEEAAQDGSWIRTHHGMREYMPKRHFYPLMIPCIRDAIFLNSLLYRWNGRLATGISKSTRIPSVLRWRPSTCCQCMRSASHGSWRPRRTYSRSSQTWPSPRTCPRWRATWTSSLLAAWTLSAMR